MQVLSHQGPIGSSLDVLFLHHRLYGTHWPLSPNQHCPSEKKEITDVRNNFDSIKKSGRLLPRSDELGPCYNRGGGYENLVI